MTKISTLIRKVMSTLKIQDEVGTPNSRISWTFCWHTMIELDEYNTPILVISLDDWKNLKLGLSYNNVNFDPKNANIRNH